MQPVIQVEQLRKAYGTTVAVEDVSFSVQPGEIFGILGPNGAGKTTAVESIVGLRKPDRGRVQVLGLDPQRDRSALAQRIGIQLQQANLADTPDGSDPGGFGLIAMRQRAESLGGSVIVESSPGEGTTIVVEIPRQNS